MNEAMLVIMGDAGFLQTIRIRGDYTQRNANSNRLPSPFEAICNSRRDHKHTA